LTSPREVLWGQLLALRPEGATLRGIPLDAFEDFIRQILDSSATPVTMTTAFYPMHRVERIACDEACAGVPSVAERFREKVGLSIEEYLNTAA
jgi:hypothetical protein